jgi:hypothetical protein
VGRCGGVIGVMLGVDFMCILRWWCLVRMLVLWLQGHCRHAEWALS